MTTINGNSANSFKINMESRNLGNLDNIKRTADNATNEDDKKLRDAANDFEAIFANQLMKSMRSSIQKSGLISGGRAEEIFQEMLDEKYSGILSKNGNLGLAELIYNELKTQKEKSSK